MNAVDHFYWLEDTELRVHFEPLFPYEREGTDAEVLEPVLDEVGFDLRSISERGYWDSQTEAAFALAERLTGVHLTPSLLSDSEFLCGIAPLPGRRRTWT